MSVTDMDEGFLDGCT